MSERQSFIDAIRANPDDDVARLVFADWLDDQADDWSRATAEYIRLSCRMDGLIVGNVESDRWVAANWFRLVPRLYAAQFKLTGTKDSLLQLQKTGTFAVRQSDGVSQRRRPFLCSLFFSRGFVRLAQLPQGPIDLVALRLIGLDQPVATLDSGGVFTSGPGRCEVHGSRFEHSYDPAYPANDIFNRIEGFDAMDYSPVRKIFIRRPEEDRISHIRRARRATEFAIRSWIESASVATPPTG